MSKYTEAFLLGWTGTNVIGWTVYRTQQSWKQYEKTGFDDRYFAPLGGILQGVACGIIPPLTPYFIACEVYTRDKD